MFRCTMKQLGLSLSEDDVHAMMRSVGIGPHGKISYAGTGLVWILVMVVGIRGLTDGKTDISA